LGVRRAGRSEACASSAHLLLVASRAAHHARHAFGIWTRVAISPRRRAITILPYPADLPATRDSRVAGWLSTNRAGPSA
jgi:hypothetical protein